MNDSKLYSYKIYTNFLLHDFMFDDPKKNPLFRMMSVKVVQPGIINQLADKCAICICKFKNPVKLENCIHIFCKQCADEWNKKSTICPICKIPSKKYFYISCI